MSSESKTVSVRIEFLEPYRLVEWHDENNRGTTELARRQSFARWHKDNNKTAKGNPFITGTLLRSQVLRAAENILFQTGGSWEEEDCCPGYGLKGKRDVLRKRPVVSWPVIEDLKEGCLGHIKNTSPNGLCPFCLLQGEKKDHKTLKFGLAFQNFVPAQCLSPDGGRKSLWSEPDELGEKRTLNRIDGPSGTALDQFSIWEMDPMVFEGKIDFIKIPEENRDNLRSFLKTCLAYVNVLCGSECKISILGSNGTQNEVRQPTSKTITAPSAGNDDTGNTLRGYAEKMAKAVGEANTRLLAESVLQLRHHDRSTIACLPQGNSEEGHFLWDKKIAKTIKVRDHLEEAAQKFVDLPWQRFCSDLSRELAVAGGMKTEGRSQRAIGGGDAENTSTPNSTPGTAPGFTKEWIFTGQLVAQTPFAIGKTVTEAEAVDNPILLDKDGKFRIPRSALRGALRLDMGAVDNQGCKAEIGPKQICLCEVCKALRGTTLRVEYAGEKVIPPQSRKRNRYNTPTGTVDEGALFDQESGPVGATFNLVLRYRGRNLPKELKTALKWWTDGKLFLGGLKGTGKGRFELKGLQSHKIIFEENRDKYVDNSGWRGDEGNLPMAPIEYKEHRAHPWEKVAWSITFDGPVLSADPAAAAITSSADKVFFKRWVIDNKNKYTDEFALKGESLRGILRTAVGKRIASANNSKDPNCLSRDHFECDCALCRVWGSTHKEGMVRIEDMTLKEEQGKQERAKGQRLDHVAIDRASGGVSDKKKFDDCPLVPTDDTGVTFSGAFWVRSDLAEDHQNLVRDSLRKAIQDLEHGLYPIGAKGSIGYGWVKEVKLNEGWLESDVKEIPSEWTETSLGQYQFEGPPLPEAVADPGNKIFHPYYFIKPDKPEWDRKRNPIPHDRFDQRKYTGVLKCSLNTLTPLIVPDTEKENTLGLQNIPDGHKAFSFFSLGGRPAIPGSSLRGMVSSVYEALTQSCYRVFDQKAHLSWRMNADTRGVKEGRIEEVNGTLKIKPYKSARFEYYAGQGPNPEWSQEQREGQEKVEMWVLEYARVIEYDFETLPGANREEYQGTVVFNKGKKVQVTIGNKQFTQKTAKERDLQRYRVGDNIAIYAETRLEDKAVFKAVWGDQPTLGDTRKPDNRWIRKTGYLKITGPCKVEIAADANSGTEYPEEWDDIRITDDGTTPPEGQRFVQYNKDYCSYTMSKWCERFFYEDTSNSNHLEINEVADKKYDTMMRSYRDNPQAPPEIFKSLPVERYEQGKGLQHGDLIYYLGDQHEQGPKKFISPVRISRNADHAPIGTHLEDKLRPCAHVCLEGCASCVGKSCSLGLYREGEPIHGLCPACHLFGTQGYKGRVRFSFAKKLEKEDNLPQATLPLLEKPRMTWTIAHERAQVPGRKFYVHHQGWKRITDENKHPSIDEQIEQTGNNCTVEYMKEGTRFEFDVRFENLKDWELGLLLYSLGLEQGLAHKLGKGKALGFGSVHIDVENIALNCPSQDKIERIVDSGLAQLSSFEPDHNDWHNIPWVKKLRALMRYEKRDSVHVRYPVLKIENDQIQHCPDEIQATPKGYVELKKDNFSAGTHLQNPWESWEPVQLVRVIRPA